MNSRISTEYVSIESRRDHELLLYFRNFTNFHTVSYIIWTPLWTKCASAAAILSNISADGMVEFHNQMCHNFLLARVTLLHSWKCFEPKTATSNYL